MARNIAGTNMCVKCTSRTIDEIDWLTDPQFLFIERAKLVERGQPVLAVPGPDDLSIPEFVDVDGLDGHFPVLRRKAHERRLMRAGEFRTNDDLVSVPKNFRGSDPEVGKGLGQIIEN